MNVVGWIALVIGCCIGNCELWVLLVNRTHSLAIRPRRLRQFRTLHDVSLLGYPFLLTWRLSQVIGPTLSDPGPVRHPFADFSFIDMTLVLWGLAGLFPFLTSVVRWHASGARCFRMADDRQVYDVRMIAQSPPGASDNAQQLTESGVRGTSRNHSLWFPWNEVYHLEVNRKRISLHRPTAAASTSSTPETSSRLRIAHLSDLHLFTCPGVDFYRFVVHQTKEQRPDLILLSGDLLDDLDLLPHLIEFLAPLTDVAPCCFILGNHDWQFPPQTIREALTGVGWIDVGSRSVTQSIGGFRLQIAGNERPWLGVEPPTAANTSADLSILLSHTPDQRDFAVDGQFDLMVAGHTHGGHVVLPLIGPVYSPSRFGTRYSAGLFRHGNLWMHVSRGLGGRIRSARRCLPELTMLDVLFPSPSLAVQRNHPVHDTTRTSCS